ncbi:unnamed protein product, partial [Brachionus calyciflorus]
RERSEWIGTALENFDERVIGKLSNFDKFLNKEDGYEQLIRELNQMYYIDQNSSILFNYALDKLNGFDDTPEAESDSMNESRTVRFDQQVQMVPVSNQNNNIQNKFANNKWNNNNQNQFEPNKHRYETRYQSRLNNNNFSQQNQNQPSQPLKSSNNQQ